MNWYIVELWIRISLWKRRCPRKRYFWRIWSIRWFYIGWRRDLNWLWIIINWLDHRCLRIIRIRLNYRKLRRRINWNNSIILSRIWIYIIRIYRLIKIISALIIISWNIFWRWPIFISIFFWVYSKIIE